VGHYTESDQSWGKHINIGPLQWGQAREIVIPMTIPAGEQPYLEAILAVPHPITKKDVKTSVKGDDREANLDARIALMRSKTVMVAHNALKLGNEGKGEAAQNAMKNLVTEITTLCEENGDPMNLTALKIDVSTRMQKALDG